MRVADRAWIALGAGIAAYEIACPPGELLSEGVDRYLSRRPWATRVAVIALAAHLLNIIPQRIDPLHQLARIVKR